MRILLLGGTGFIGSNLGARLVEADYAVTVICREQPSAPNPAIEYLVGGLESPELLNQLLPSCSHVFHLASATTPGSSRLASAMEVNGNLVPLTQLLDSLQQVPHVHLVFVSSGGAIYGDQAPAMADEQTPTSPISYYGAGKAAIEVFLRAYQAQTDHGVTVLRPSNLFGPGQLATANFGIVPTLFDCVLNQRPFELWGDGETVRDYLYVGDFADLCVRSIDWSSDRKVFTVFNAGCGTGHTINELCAEIGSISGFPVDVVRQPPRSVDVQRIVLDSSAVRSAVGWEPRTSLRRGLQLTWDWLNKQDSV